MNVNELRGAARIAEAAFKAALPPAYVANGLTAMHTTVGTSVFIGDSKTTLSDNQAVSLRDWLIAAYPLDHAPASAPASEWVSVGERLPDTARNVLVWTHDSDKPLMAWIDSASRWRWFTAQGEVIDGVTHWQELPKRPTK